MVILAFFSCHAILLLLFVLALTISCLDEGSFLLQEEAEKMFLASADFLSSHGMPTLISNMQAAATEVLKGKQLKDFFNTSLLHETMGQILDIFVSMGSPHHWVDYLMPEYVRLYLSVESSSNDTPHVSVLTKFDQLMVETCAVLSSAEFGIILDKSFKTVMDALIEDIKVQCGESNFSAGIPLARLVPRVVQISPLLLEEPSRNRFIQIIQNLPEVGSFLHPTICKHVNLIKL